MGGLIFGGALMNGYCRLSNTSSWYASGMPSNGSSVVNLLANYCSNSSSAIRLILDKCIFFSLYTYFINVFIFYILFISSFSSELIFSVVLCQNLSPYAAYGTLKPGYPGLAKVHQFASQRVNGTYFLLFIFTFPFLLF